MAESQAASGITGFDIIGDVHGCLDELAELLEALGYTLATSRDKASAPPGRQAIFVGDLIDRGPDSVGVVRLVMAMCQAGAARMCIGNHDDKLRRYLHGNAVQLSGSFADTAPAFSAMPDHFQQQVRDWLDSLPFAIVLADGLVAVHAAYPDGFTQLTNHKQRSVALFGIVDHSRLTEHGYPIRVDWAQDYSGSPRVVHGHTPVEAPRHVNGVICVDTACVFGGSLTAFRWPEWEIVDVASHEAYAQTPVPRIESRPSQRIPHAQQQVR